MRDIEALRGIITTLVALARLAQRAAGLPFPLRFVLLAILRLAEAVARDFVVEEMGVDWLGDSPESQNRPADATLLAMRFCALAEALVVLFRLEMACLTLRPEGAPRAIAHCAGRVAAVIARRLPLPPLRGPPARCSAGAPANTLASSKNLPEDAEKSVGGREPARAAQTRSRHVALL